ncbi:thiamine ABC transporter substrate-binding protein [Demequina sp.]|uniref:thiamine ABC transporter substrate-binding protein n=1 Tax=Demequina sp. TaxID=2050685 RepID=UPI003D0E46BC
MRTLRVAVPVIAVATLAACTSTQDPATPSGSAQPADTEVTVVTHDSFAVPDAVVAQFERDTGIKVTFVAPGDAGAMVNQLILTKDAPLGDVAYGVDNTFASRALDEGVFADYTSSAPAAVDAAQYAIEGSEALTAVDFSDVCLNYDLAYFEDNGLAVPQTFDDLLKPEYKSLVSVTNPATSSPGLAFLLATIAAKGDGWQDYWSALVANDVRVTASWSDTYYTDFSAPNYGGDYPIVLSYASSPPFEVIDGEPTTAALLDTCFRQVEYVGVLEGAKHPTAAGKVVDWMLSDEFQAALPENMYVYPVSSAVEVPADWATYAPLASAPWSVPAADIAANRDQWIKDWTAVVTP